MEGWRGRQKEAWHFLRLLCARISRVHQPDEPLRYFTKIMSRSRKTHAPVFLRRVFFDGFGAHAPHLHVHVYHIHCTTSISPGSESTTTRQSSGLMFRLHPRPHALCSLSSRCASKAAPVAWGGCAAAHTSHRTPRLSHFARPHPLLPTIPRSALLARAFVPLTSLPWFRLFLLSSRHPPPSSPSPSGRTWGTRI